MIGSAAVQALTGDNQTSGVQVEDTARLSRLAGRVGEIVGGGPADTVRAASHNPAAYVTGVVEPSRNIKVPSCVCGHIPGYRARPGTALDEAVLYRRMRDH